MLSKKSAQSKLGREKATTGAVVRYQKSTAGAAHTNGVDEEMDDFVLVRSMQAYHVVVQLLTLMQHLEMRISSSSIVGYAHEPSQTRG